jgi:hypothetical protein
MTCSPPPARFPSRRRGAVLAWFRPFAPLLLILFLARCFEYGDAPRDRIAVGRDVRITLTPDARTTLASKIGTQVRSLNGRVQTADTSGLTIAMTRTTLLDASEASWNNEIVSIPSSDIASIEQRRISGGKTFAMVVLVAGITAVVAVSVGLAASSSGGNGQNGVAK